MYTVQMSPPAAQAATAVTWPVGRSRHIEHGRSLVGHVTVRCSTAPGSRDAVTSGGWTGGHTLSGHVTRLAKARCAVRRGHVTQPRRWSRSAARRAGGPTTTPGRMARNLTENKAGQVTGQALQAKTIQYDQAGGRSAQVKSYHNGCHRSRLLSTRTMEITWANSGKHVENKTKIRNRENKQ